MLTISDARRAQSANYYIELVRAGYYEEGGEKPGTWYGKGATKLGLSGEITRHDAFMILNGFSPESREPFIQNAGRKNRRAYWDLTFNAPKSVSVAWSQADPKVREAIETAHKTAVEKALSYLGDVAAFTRRGKGGREREPAALTFLLYEHGTSRALDPHLHTHALLANLGARSDGTWGGVETEPIFQNKMAAGALYRAELAVQLEERLGLSVVRERDWFQIKGVHKGLIEEFSKRLEQLRERGSPATATPLAQRLACSSFRCRQGQ